MGRLLVLEGLDGSGKSTQTERLKEALLATGETVRQIKLPDYDAPSSTLVRQYLAGDFGKDPNAVNAYAASSFYAVDRVASFLLDWKRDYDAGSLILADRYTTSNPIYQMTKLPKEEWDAYLTWVDDYEFGKLGLPRPDRVIFLDMPVEVSQKMMTRRYEGDEAKKDVHESNVQFLNACREAALYTAERWNWSVVRCWEGEEPRTIDAIAADVFALAAR
ncbi:MAG: deoxynucleoside kinase [Clostridia bacterium]|nr:deoxynucleoside kinase [Clostridia bacterium]